MKNERDLFTDGEEAFSRGVHKNELVLVLVVTATVAVDSEDNLSIGVVDGETIANEEVGGLEDSQLLLLL